MNTRSIGRVSGKSLVIGKDARGFLASGIALVAREPIQILDANCPVNLVPNGNRYQFYVLKGRGGNSCPDPGNTTCALIQ